MVTKKNNVIQLADFSKNNNVFRWFGSIFLALFGITILYVFLVYLLKISGYNDQELTWMPISSESFPYKGEAIEYIGLVITFFVGTFFMYASALHFFNGQISFVLYNEYKREIVAIRNGFLKKRTELAIDNIKYLRKKREKRSPSFITTGQHHIHTISLRMNKAYAVLKDTNEYVLLFDSHDKKKFDAVFREINKFIKEKR